MSTEERVRTAGEATAASVREIRPLALPENGAVSAPPRGHRFRAFLTTRQTWLIPLGAAAVVAALALSLVIVRQIAGPRTAPANPAAIAGIPQYYAIASEGPVSHDETAVIAVTVGDVRTGKTLTKVALPPINTFGGVNSAVGVSAAADDRTFVVGRRDGSGDFDYFLVRIAPGAKQVATVEHLPVPAAQLGVLLGFAVSPDGRELAVMSVRGNGTTLRTYSVASGATLRTWTAGTWHYQDNEGLATAVSWTADGRDVAFSTSLNASTSLTAPGGVLEERLIGATAPSGDLAARSKLVLKAPGNCSSLLLTPDGGTVVCGARANYRYPAAPDCGTNPPMYVAYSAATGKRLRVLYQYTGPCEYGEETVLWTDNSARHVIGESEIVARQKPLQYSDDYGVASAGSFVPFPVAQHGQWWSGPAF